MKEKSEGGERRKDAKEGSGGSKEEVKEESESRK